MNIDELIDYDTLWLQSTPSVAAIFYHKYLPDTHVLYCPDDDSTPQQPRQIAKGIINVINSNDKKIVIHFMLPCTEKRRENIFKFILKSKPDLSSYCLSIPTSLFQSNLLLGWSAEIKDELWKKRCAIELSDEALMQFTPPTIKHAQSEWSEFSKEFVVSRKIFSKKALIVDMTGDMIEFDMQKGIFFNNAVDNSIRGWMRASHSTPRTLIWIIDERTLYGETINNVYQEKRASLLRKYRKILFSSIEAFATTMPIYCYLLDYFATANPTLSNCLAQIQHRHHICLSRTILLTWSKTEKFSQDYIFGMKAIHLVSMPIFDEYKWLSIYMKHFSEMEDNDYDDINYISPELLGIDSSTEYCNTPMLSESNDALLLTIHESVGNNDILHSVSAKSSKIFDKWVQIITKAALNDKDVDSNKEKQIKSSSKKTSSLTILDKVLKSLTLGKIKEYIDDNNAYEQGMSITDTLYDTQCTSNTNSVTLSAMAKGTTSKAYILSLEINKDGMISHGSCSCPVGTSGQCKHCAATLKFFVQDHQAYTISSYASQQLANNSDSLLSTKKRSFEESQDESTDAEDSDKKKYKSTESSLDTDNFSINTGGRVEANEKSSFSQVYSTVINVNSSSEGNSFSSVSLPSIPSSVYCSASSKSLSSLSSRVSFPTIPSSGSLGYNSSSGKEPSNQQSTASSNDTEDGTFLYDQSTITEKSQTYDYSADDEDQPTHATAQTQSYNSESMQDEESTTQPYSPLESDPTQQAYDTVTLSLQPAEEQQTQTYDSEAVLSQAILLDDSDEEQTQPYDTEADPTQPILLDDSDEEQLTQPYDTAANYNEEGSPKQLSLPINSNQSIESNANTQSKSIQGTLYDTANSSLNSQRDEEEEEENRDGVAYDFDAIGAYDNDNDSNDSGDTSSATEWLSELI